MKFKYLYGPVSSWRLGRSLGIDLLSGSGKLCNFDCVYCQVGKTKVYTLERSIYAPTGAVMKEIKALPKGLEADHLTFSGCGEPTLAKNMGDVIRAVKKIRKEKIAVLTNSMLLYRKDVQRDLKLCDFVAVKLDAASEDTFAVVSRAGGRATLRSVIDGICAFRKIYTGRLAVQIMFLEQNKGDAPAMARIVKKIRPDEVQINTPLRAPRKGALTAGEIARIKKYFSGFNVVTAFDRPKKAIRSFTGKKSMAKRGRARG